MQKSDSIGKLSKALTAVQAAIKPAIKDADNPFFKSKYADLNSVWDTCRDLLAKNGLAVIQGNSVGMDNTVIVETILSHESGEWIQSELCLPLAKHDPQGVGSAVTYGRRYGLSAIVGIVADIDDDGNHASGKTNGQAKASTPPLPPKPPASVEAPTGRELQARLIQQLCKDLNSTGKDSITWTPPKLNEYVNDMFEVANFDTANEAQLATVAVDLAKRLAVIKEGK